MINMKQCPTCKAKYAGKRICHRCKTDLGILTDIEDSAKAHLENAVAAFVSKDFNSMFFHAKRSCSLRRTPEAAKTLACASLLVSRFNLAVDEWSSVNRMMRQLQRANEE